MDCPLCALTGVTFDELCFHLSSAHPGNSPVPPSSPDGEAAKNGCDGSSGAAGGTREEPEGQSSAGERALATSGCPPPPLPKRSLTTYVEFLLILRLLCLRQTGETGLSDVSAGLQQLSQSAGTR